MSPCRITRAEDSGAERLQLSAFEVRSTGPPAQLVPTLNPRTKLVPQLPPECAHVQFAPQVRASLTSVNQVPPDSGV